MTFESRVREELRSYGDSLRDDPPPVEEMRARGRRRRRARLAGGVSAATAAVAGVVAVAVVVVWGPGTEIEITPADPPVAGSPADHAYVLETDHAGGDGRVLRVDAQDGSMDVALAATGERVLDVAVAPQAGLLAVVTAENGGSVLYGVEMDGHGLAFRHRLPSGRHALQTTLPTAQPSVAVSPDGRWIHVTVGDWHDGSPSDVAILTYDVDAGQFLSEEVPVERCGAALLYTTDPDGLVVLCPNLDFVRWIQRTDDGWRPDSETSSDRRVVGMVAAAVNPADHLLYVITKQGEVWSVDTTTGEISTGASLEIPDDQYVVSHAVGLTADGGYLYVGLGPLADREEQTGRMQATILAIFDTADWSTVRHVHTDRPFTSLGAMSAEQVLLADNGLWTNQPSLTLFDWPTGTTTLVDADLDGPPSVILPVP